MFGRESVGEQLPLVRREDDSSLITSGYSDHCLSALLEHEPHIPFLFSASQPILDASAQDSSHSFLYGSLSETTHTSPLQHLDNSWTDTSTLASAHSQEASYSSSKSSVSVGESSPPNTDRTPSTLPDGKEAINAAPTYRVCRICGTTFTSMLRYNKHRRTVDCRNMLSCDSCGKVFKHEKSLQRHQGTDKSSPACSQRRESGSQAKPFACICNMAYARKDGLLRHFKNKHARQNPLHHRCRACDHSPCSCG